MRSYIVKKWIVEIKEIVMPVFLMVFIMTFIVSKNKIPSGSMIATLNIKDHIIVSMLPYYYRNPVRGEIVVFNGGDGKKWIKRVIGLPGETIDIREGDIYINGLRLDETAYLSDSNISALNPILPTEVTFPYIIPDNYYFLMGDNRLESYDCRYFGPIERKEITGKALYRVYPFNQIGNLNE